MSGLVDTCTCGAPLSMLPADHDCARPHTRKTTMSDPKDILRRAALKYHQIENRRSSCGSMDIDVDLLLSGMVEIGTDSRLHVTDKGRAFLASADTHPKDGDALAAPLVSGAVAKPDAQ